MSHHASFLLRLVLILFAPLVLIIFPGRLAFSDEHPDIILITGDTTRQDHLGAYGYKEETSPNLDALSKDALVFLNAFTPIPFTTPSHESIFSSFYPFVRQYETMRHKILPEILKENGYKTAAFISAHPVDIEYGFDRGFEKFSGLPGKKQELESEGHGIRKAKDTTDAALSWLKNEHARQKPLFLWVHYYDPHTPYLPPAQYVRDTVEDKKKWAWQASFTPLGVQSVEETTEDNEGWLSLNDDLRENHFTGKFNEEEQNVIRSLYDGEIRYMDHEIGRLFDYFKANGSYDKTVVIFMADHGESLGERENYYGHHKFLYEETLKIPLIMKLPGVPSEKIDLTARSIDVMPSLLNYLKIKDDSVGLRDGRDLLSILSEPREKNSISSFICTQFKHFNKRGFRTDRWKYWKDNEYGEDRAFLYDLDTDPGEKNNVINEFPEKAKELQDLLSPFEPAYKAARREDIIYQETKRKVYGSAPEQEETDIMNKNKRAEKIKWLKSLGYL